jgi:hypothetical protein
MGQVSGFWNGQASYHVIARAKNSVYRSRVFEAVCGLASRSILSLKRVV